MVSDNCRSFQAIPEEWYYLIIRDGFGVVVGVGVVCSGDMVDGPLKQFGYLVGCKPYGLISKLNLNLRFAPCVWNNIFCPLCMKIKLGLYSGSYGMYRSSTGMRPLFSGMDSF